MSNENRLAGPLAYFGESRKKPLERREPPTRMRVLETMLLVERMAQQQFGSRFIVAWKGSDGTKCIVVRKTRTHAVEGRGKKWLAAMDHAAAQLAARPIPR